MVNNELIHDYNEMINGLTGKNYLECIIAMGAAPTITGVKPSNILTLKGKKQICYIWIMHKDEICSRLGLEYFQVVLRENRITVLFYKTNVLEQHINQEQNLKFLGLLGYAVKSTLMEKLHLLKERFSYQCPHEMGIFLGIPVKDVCGFLEHNGKNCLMCRYWKVYHNADQAKKTFEKFDMSKVYIMNELLKKHNAA